MELLVVILLVVAAGCFGAAAFRPGSTVNWLALGLLAWVVAVLLPAITAL